MRARKLPCAVWPSATLRLHDVISLGLGDRMRALDYLEQAYTANSLSLAWLKVDRIYDPLRAEPRFIALMKRLNFLK